jgi:hypothetical protein
MNRLSSGDEIRTEVRVFGHVSVFRPWPRLVTFPPRETTSAGPDREEVPIAAAKSASCRRHVCFGGTLTISIGTG